MRRGASIVLVMRPLAATDGRYYTSDRAPEVNEVMGWTSPGIWLGAGSRALGLGGAVTESDLQVVLTGSTPRGNVQPSSTRRRSGFDLIVAAPKPISVLFSSSDATRSRTVVAAHVNGVKAALTYLEHRALAMTRTTGAARESVPAAGATAACFTHGVSRSGDPHLHSHLVVANAAHGLDGRFGALDQRTLRAHLQAADSLYQAEVRLHLRQQLGVSWVLGIDNVIRAAEVSDADCVALSGRSEERRRGPWREAKATVGRRFLEAEWQRRLEAKPILEEPTRFVRNPDVLDEHRLRSHLHQGAVTARRLVEGIAGAAIGGIAATTVAQELRRSNCNLGWGIEETSLLPNDFSIDRRTQRELGQRPTEPRLLARWWEARRVLGRHVEQERLIVRDGGRGDDMLRLLARDLG